MPGPVRLDNNSHQPPRIVRLDVYRVPLPLTEPLRHATAATSTLDDVFLVLTTTGGVEGFAEIRGNGEYATGYDAASVLRALDESADRLLGAAAETAADCVLAMSGNRLAAALVNGAALDALARAADQPLWRFLGGSRPPPMPTHAAIGFVDSKRASMLAAEAVVAGFGRIKVRVGDGSLDADVARIAAVRAAIPPTVAIAVDANGAWTAPTAIEAARRLAPHTIAWIEQPTPAGDHDAMRAVRNTTTIPVIADESIRTAEDVARTAAAGSASGVHLKLEKCGTVAELRRAAAIAREAGLLIELGQMDQGRLGTALLAHLAVTIDADAYELAGFARVAHDVATGLELEAGAIALTDRPGIGVMVALPDSGLVMTRC